MNESKSKQYFNKRERCSKRFECKMSYKVNCENCGLFVDGTNEIKLFDVDMLKHCLINAIPNLLEQKRFDMVGAASAIIQLIDILPCYNLKDLLDEFTEEDLKNDPV